MHFFLQGPKKLGKSYLLREALIPYRTELAGFAVQRLYQDGAVVGFRAQLLRGELPELDGSASPDLEGVFLYRGRQDLAVLEQVIAQVEQDCANPRCRLILLDEIGGMELANPAFMEPLHRILTCGKPCLGVFKSVENLAGTFKQQGLPREISALHRALEQQLCDMGELITLSAENRQDTARRLQEFLCRSRGLGQV